jgi:ABC-type sugar transport system ATPase subunit
MTGIALQSICKDFGPVVAIEDVSLEIPPHQFTTLVGPSGCGKSTLLNITAGLERPTRGRVLIDGRDVTELEARDRDVAMVFQSYALYPHLSVRRNLAFPLRVKGVGQQDIARQVTEVAELVGIKELLDRRPKELSGGQRQRVAIGRAIIRSTRVCLLDEPLSNLDAGLRVRMRADLKLLFSRIGTTVMFVTHDQAEAMTMSDRIIVLNQGRVQQSGPPLEVYRRPANTFVAGFIGSPRMNILPATIEQTNDEVTLRGGSLRLSFPATALRSAAGQARRDVIMGLRPESLSTNPFAESAPLLLEAKLIEHLGHGAVIHYVTEMGEKLIGFETREVEIEAGWRGRVYADLSALKLFDAATQMALG